jgi:hypothetical protein
MSKLVHGILELVLHLSGHGCADVVISQTIDFERLQIEAIVRVLALHRYYGQIILYSGTVAACW